MEPINLSRTGQPARQKVIATWGMIKPLDAPINMRAVERALELKGQVARATGRQVRVAVHSYQRREVKMVADYIGDSFELAQKAAGLPDDSIVLHCTVDFMAQTTKILKPSLKVVVPSHHGGCGLADSITGAQIRGWRTKEAARLGMRESELPLVLYINTYPSAKAEATAICTSANSLKVIEWLPQEHVLFAPDINLYHSIREGSTKKIIPWKGACPIHKEFTPEMVRDAVYAAQETGKGRIGIMLHPECNPEVREYVQRGLGDYLSAVLSTGGMKKFVNEHPEIAIWVIGTEIGLIETLQDEHHGVIFRPVYKHNSCDESCVCPYMKSVSIEGIIGVLEGLLSRSMRQVREWGKIISVQQRYADRAREAIELMIRIGRGEGPKDGKPGY